MKKLSITVIVAAKDEEKNIRKCLRSLQRAEKVYVVDSKSKDDTAKIAKEMGVKVVDFCYVGGYPKKRQWALDNLKIITDWVMMIDADEEVGEDLWREISRRIDTDENVNAYLVKKEFHFLGKKMKYGGFSHRAIILWRVNSARFEETLAIKTNDQDMEVHERVIVRDNKIEIMNHPLIHNDFKNLQCYYDRHNKYSTWEAQLRSHYYSGKRCERHHIGEKIFGNAQERRRFIKRIVVKLPFEHVLWFIYHYFLRLGFAEGRRGLIASIIRMEYIRQVHFKMFEAKLHEED